ncbi:MAG: hypothetical protein JO062_05900 [Bryobacterales bacterium]|nr:hypothetical protein [Bryobacterales bacterium]
MKFAAVIDYTTDAAKIAATRPAHREYLKNLLDTNRLVISGPFTDDTGGILVYNADSAEQAEALIRGDPFAQAGVFVSWKIREWRVVMSNPKLCEV